MEKVEEAIGQAIDDLSKDPTKLEEREGEEPDVEIKQVTRTDDGNFYPHLKVDKGDSFLHLVNATDEEILYISHAHGEYKGDFKDMMNQLVEHTGTNHVKFTMVVNDNLKKVLNGFEEKKEMHEELGEQMTVLEGEWEK